MPVAALTTLGCKVNQYETEQIAGDFARAGFTLADFDAPADVYVINTCSVTEAADKKSRYLARKASRTNPDALVVVTGCHAQMTLDRGEWVEGATLIVPNHDKMATLAHAVQARPDVFSYSSSPAATAPVAARSGPRTRATLKVQDGCEHFCGFCSIPYTRKVLASRPFDEVVAEARRIGQSGVREIVVTGICVGAYNEATGSGGPDLADLLTAVADQPGVERVRLSSIQPIEVGERLIDAFATHPHLCPHLHLSCQSGDDAVLARMNRPYDTAFYLDLLRQLRARVLGVAITTDLIVGYPGETREEHENTLRFAQAAAFQKTHVFRYSPRPRTHAESLPDDVPDAEKKRRHAELQAVVNQTNRAFTSVHIGQTLPVLVEGGEGAHGTISGHTPNYIVVRFAGPGALRGQIVPVRLSGVSENGDAAGELALSEAEVADRLTRDAAPRPSTDFLPLAMA